MNPRSFILLLSALAQSHTHVLDNSKVPALCVDPLEPPRRRRAFAHARAETLLKGPYNKAAEDARLEAAELKRQRKAERKRR